MAGVYDADSHIAEPEAMWQKLDPEFHPRRPVIVSVPPDTLYGKADHMWLIDGRIFPRMAGRGSSPLVTPVSQTFVREMPDVPERDMTDLPKRLKQMDLLGTERQIVFPTLFLTYLTDDVPMEVALCQAYNRHLAEVCAQSGDRIDWTLVPPLRDIEASVRELKIGAERGAKGVFFRGIEKDLMLDDPYFFPVYEEAQALNLTICIHQGSGAPALNSLVDVRRSHTFTHGRIPPVVAFRNLVANKIPELFPRLRWGFIETGASWVPFALHNLKSLGHEPAKWGPKLMEKYNMWISYEVTEDLPYLVKYIGEDRIVMGTDYGHHGREGIIADPSAQLHMVKTVRERDYPGRLADKLLIDNPRALFGLS